jgi:alginate O-acetyltransferase complex protein AlgI
VTTPMLFTSTDFLFGFLPVCLVGFYGLAKINRQWAETYLLLGSLVFYGWSNFQNVPLLAGSIIFNYYAGNQIRALADRGLGRAAASWCSFGIFVNVALLIYFKYTNFILDNVNVAFGTEFVFRQIILPLGISFYSFQRIAYLIDCARGEIRKSNFLDFSLFALFFPQLISGPIVLYNEIAPQFEGRRFIPGANYNLLAGVVIFTIGLFKKIVIADNTAFIANPLFDAASRGTPLDVLSGWLAALSFTIQLYFDFSGYSDMAIGLARMFGILLPLNFHSPLKATNIADYWRRWHMTLNRFMLSYFYQPLALALTRKAVGMSLSRWPNFIISVVLPAFATFVVIGAWHGAGWTFVLFGLMHATYVCTAEAWREFRRQRRKRLKVSDRGTRPSVLGRTLAHVTTLVCVLLANVMFRADRVATAGVIYRGMFGLTGGEHIVLPEVIRPEALFFVLLGCLVIAVMPNTQQFMGAYRSAVNWRQWRNVVPSLITWQWRPNIIGLASIGMLAAVVITATLMGISREPAQFLYFKF